MFGKKEKNTNYSTSETRSSFSKKPLYAHAMQQEEKRGREMENYNKLQEARHDNYKINSESGEQYNQSTGRKEGTWEMTAKSLYKAETGSKIMLPARDIALGIELRKRMQEGDSSAIQIAYLFAFCMDFVFDALPVGALISSFIGFFVLFIMLWGYGNWKVKALRAFLLFLEIIPMVGLLPMNIICVMHASHVLKKRVKNAKIKYAEWEMQIRNAA
jgi:hypothetical protein